MRQLFVGLSSGLSWLAWAAGAPVVMISGFTHPTNEFATPYRVINWHTCNSCWNDDTAPFDAADRTDFLWCPRHKDTPRMFECSRLITVAPGHRGDQAGARDSGAASPTTPVMASVR